MKIWRFSNLFYNNMEANKNMSENNMTDSVLSHVGDGVRQIAPYRPGRSAEEVAAERGVSDVIKLASNENPLGACDAAVLALRELSGDSVSRYPDGGCRQLRTAVAKQLNVSQEELIFGNGSNEILELAAQLMLSENDVAVYSQHAFLVYQLAVAARRGRGIAVPAGDDYAHDLPALAECAIKNRARLIYIGNPNNPTGTWHSPQAIGEWMTQIPSDTLVVLDEAYREYVDGKCTLSSERFPNLLITRTFSKIHGLAGLRIGYGVGAPSLIDMLNRIRQPFNVGGAAQAAAAAAMNDFQHVERSVSSNAAGMKEVAAGLDALSLRRLPSRANFITFCLDSADNAGRVYEGLLDNGIIIRPLADYGMPEWLRMTIGTESENKRFLDSLKRIIK